MKIKVLLLLLCHIFFLANTHSQVTIGSDIEPRTGSLLDLKENENKNKDANSEKGLGLPRVALISVDTLTIDVTDNVSDYVGVTVYNITNNSELAEGAYWWDGTVWQQIISVKKPGLDGQMLISQGPGNPSQWVSMEEAHIPTVNMVAMRSTTSTKRTGGIFSTVGFNQIPHVFDIEYDSSSAVFTVKKAGYYQVNVYNTLNVRIDSSIETDGTASTVIYKNPSTVELGTSAWYQNGTSSLSQSFSGILYFGEDDAFTIRTTYTRDYYVTKGSVSMTYFGE